MANLLVTTYPDNVMADLRQNTDVTEKVAFTMSHKTGKSIGINRVMNMAGVYSEHLFAPDVEQVIRKHYKLTDTDKITRSVEVDEHTYRVVGGREETMSSIYVRTQYKGVWVSGYVDTLIAPPELTRFRIIKIGSKKQLTHNTRLTNPELYKEMRQVVIDQALQKAKVI